MKDVRTLKEPRFTSSMSERKRKSLTNFYVMLWVLSNEFNNLAGSFFLGRKNQVWVAIGIV